MKTRVRERVIISIALAAVLCVALIGYCVARSSWIRHNEELIKPVATDSAQPAWKVTQGPVSTPTARWDLASQPGTVRREQLVMQSRGDAVRLLNSGRLKVTLSEVGGWTADPNAKEVMNLDDSWTVDAACFSTAKPGKVMLRYFPKNDPVWRDDAWVVGVRSLNHSSAADLGPDCDVMKDYLDLNAA
ncbi:Uncharacterised protein [Mycobacteroides abscessus]|uniref:hypothetical protein n=1 Tax=Mycobacteroides abscessus TaxID=36809 RepID=UPI0005E66344|nr:hypothetical protein [Mycobacteroides abscessus]CPT93766.1 Uncharacterised protein [Mycobacteroides abscessus]CPW12842.1 Uncharacterised protein [Mycobacteroides abscessus]CQA07168.1 Uncharacterised protein [Mycobacteroides abscessus]SKF98454.1 Uncharacterised protein [Mycobacteroides abscessus subsp. massiliense]SKG27496.1 Uncharacterised protein [Mycobacteroides abscessus subsp. massiliense]